MPPEIVDHCIAGLDRMKSAMCRGRFEQGAKFYEPVTAAARIEGIERDRVTLVALESSPIGQSYRRDSTLVTNSFSLNCEPEQVSPLPARINFFHDGFDFLGRELGRDQIIFKRNKAPNVVHGFWTGDKVILFIENAVHCSVHSCSALPQSFQNRRADQCFDIARLTGATANVKCSCSR